MTILDRPRHTPTWLSWVGAVTSVLRHLGHDVDAAEVAGRSGYAFHITVNDGVCLSGPTCLSWAGLAEHSLALGRSTLLYHSWDCLTKETRCGRTLAHARQVLEIARREAEEGRPCVVWGIGVPEFSVVHGVEGDEFVVVPWGPVPERCRYDELEAPGGPAVFAFPTPRAVHESADRLSVAVAAAVLGRDRHHASGPGGLDAFDAWIGHLAAGRAATHGNSYNAQCWAEARAFARDFTAALAARHPAVAALGDARAALGEGAAALAEVASLFPFEFRPEPVSDRERIAAARNSLLTARAADAAALAAFRRALADWPAGPGSAA